MTKDAKIKNQNIPKLRFPGFKDVWVEKSLGELGKIITGSTPSTLNPTFYGDDFMFVSPADIAHSRFVYSTNTKVSKSGFENGRKIQKGSVMFVCIGSTIGKIAQTSEDCITNQQINSLEANKYNTDDFIFFKLQYISKRIKLLAGKQAVPMINKTDFSLIKTYFPSLSEQEKIASFLGLVDEWIENLRNQKENLEKYKKGIMQKIFSQEIRFKDKNGNKFPKWEKVRFGDVFTFKTTNSFSRENLNYDSGEVKNIHYGDIHTKFRTHFDINKETLPFVNKEIVLSKTVLNSYCKEGDLIIADASEDYADIGKCIEIINLNNEKVLAGLHTLQARPGHNLIFTGFSGYLMKSSKVRSQIIIIAQGTKVLSISTGRIGKIIFYLPLIPEQQKITDFLTSVDKVIESKEKQITQAELWKKGLIQNLFV